MDKSKIYLDLSKCTEEEQKHIFSLLPEPTYEIQYSIDSNNYMLDFDDGEFWVNDTLPLDGKQELTYPEFIQLFEEPTRLPSELLREYFKNTPKEQVLKDWENTAHLDCVNSPKVLELFKGGEGENNGGLRLKIPINVTPMRMFGFVVLM